MKNRGRFDWLVLMLLHEQGFIKTTDDIVKAVMVLLEAWAIFDATKVVEVFLEEAPFDLISTA